MYIYSQDPKERRALKGFGQDKDLSPEEARRENNSPADPHWHTRAKDHNQPEIGNIPHKSRSQPLRKVFKTSSGSGMQYRPRDTVPVSLEPSAQQQQETAASTKSATGQKSRSQFFRRVPPRSGFTFPIGSHSSSSVRSIGPTGPCSFAPASAAVRPAPHNAHGRELEVPVQVAWVGTPSVQELFNETDFEAFFAPPALD